MKVIFIQGPTGTGKSHLALELQQKFGGAIINCDSIQVYKDLNLGSSKPTPEEFKKAPHFLYSYIPTGERLAAGQYSRDFFNVIETQKENFKVFYVVGGTGFYFQALEKGMLPVPPVSQEIQQRMFHELEEKGEDFLFQKLIAEDPAYAKKISPHDHQRLVRALEIIETSGKNVTHWNEQMNLQKKDFPYPLLKLGLDQDKDKEVLKERIKKRTHQMLQQGWVEEVQNLIDQGFIDWPPLHSTGYQQVLDFISSKTTITNLETEINTATFQLIKKQRTWFRRDPKIHGLIHWQNFETREMHFSVVQDFLDQQARPLPAR